MLNVCPHRKLRGVWSKSVPYCSVQILHSKTSVWGSWGKSRQKVNDLQQIGGLGHKLYLIGGKDARFVHTKVCPFFFKGPLQRTNTPHSPILSFNTGFKMN